MNPEELLNKYLDRELNPAERDEFEALYRQSGAFKKQVDLYRDIVKGMEWSEIQKIRSEVKLVHDMVSSDSIDAVQFEHDVTRALALKNRQQVKEEIQNAMNTKSKKTGWLIALGSRSPLAIAASLIAIVSIAVLIIWTSRSTLSDAGKNAMAEAYILVKKEVQLTGIADPSKENNNHESRVFELLAKNELKQATEVNDAFYKDHIKDYRYFQILGWIYYHSGKWTQARESFLTASKMGDPCMSKLLYALLIPYEKQSKEIIGEVRLDNSCKDSESVNQLLNHLSQ